MLGCHKVSIYLEKSGLIFVKCRIAVGQNEMLAKIGRSTDFCIWLYNEYVGLRMIGLLNWDIIYD